MKVLVAVIFCIVVLESHSQQKMAVHFEFDKFSLTRHGRAQLDSFIAATKTQQAGHQINLDGYCDNIGSDQYNQGLSEKRVATIKQYLLRNGIDVTQISETKGHGEQGPLNENRTPGERQLNRRVEIIITGSDQSVSTNTEETKTLTEKLTDSTVKEGTSIVLKNMNFYGGTPFLLPASFGVVDELLSIMRRNPSLVIQIEGHICCISDPGDSPYIPTGTGLSEERARAIYAELVGKGIDAARVSYKGFGHSMPIYPYPERTEEERMANRRVEVKVISR